MINKEQEEYLQTFYDPKFTEFQFTRALLTLLNKNGVSQINSDKLMQKLYYYYQKPEFRELFKDIVLARNSLAVDISDSLYREKFFGRNIWWDNLDGNILNLVYDDLDPIIAQVLTPQELQKLEQMAIELSTTIKVEHNSPHETIIFNTNPNTSFTLVSGLENGKNASFELLTDGEIENISYLDSQAFANCFFESPIYFNALERLESMTVADTTLKNATFAIKQGLYGREVRHVTIYSNITDFDSLSMISEFTNQPNQSASLNKEKPLVRKLILK